MLTNIHDIKKQLTPIFSKDALKHPIGYWMVDFIRNHRTLYTEKGFSSVLTLVVTKRSRYTLDESALIYASLLIDKEIFNLFYNHISIPLQKAFRVLAETEALDGEDMIELTGLQISDTQLNIFPNRGYRWNPIYSFPYSIRKLILGHLGLINFDLTPIQEIEKTDIIYHGEEKIFQETSLLLTYIKENGVKTTKQGRPTSAELKKIVKITKIKEFYPNEKGMVAMLRTLLSTLLILDLPQSKFRTTEPIEKTIDYLIKGLYQKKRRNSVFDLFFPYKGIYKYRQNSDGLESDILIKLKKLPINGWLSFENVFNFLHYNCDILPLETHITRNEVYYDFHYYGEEEINNLYLEFVQKPFIKGTFFLFAALGIVDIAYDENPEEQRFKHDIPNPYNKLKYIRLNEFGAYVLGINKDYTPPKQEDNNELYLSSEALVITTNEDNMTAEIVLKNYMKKVSNTRYVTDYETFLAKCNSVTEIQNKISSFKKTLNLKFPENWEDFFKEIKGKSSSFQGRSFKIYELKKDPELLRLIARDEVLKPIIIKAENYHILIKTKDLPTLKKRLLKFGYFLKI